MKLYLKITGVLFALVILFGVSSSAFAQTTLSSTSMLGSSGAVSSGPICFNFPVNIMYGASDSTTQNSVTSLQTFLAQQGYFNSAYIGTGLFGPLTLQAVERFQGASGLPTTGYVGPLTRAVIVHRCGYPTPTPTPSNAVTISSIAPQQDPAGATVTIYGSGFTGNNTVLFDNGVAQENVVATIPPSTSYICPPGAFCPATSAVNSAEGNMMINANAQMLTFTVPTALSAYCTGNNACPMYMRVATPGQYSVTVVNSNGTSNAVPFTITSGSVSSTGGNLTITGLNAPSSLTVGQTGTWLVQTQASSNSGNLQYSVNWGDTTAYPVSTPQAEAASVTNSASFSHAYQEPGTYSPVFTVSDSYGHSVSTTNTITVLAEYH